MYSEWVCQERVTPTADDCIVGVLTGEGVGPEVIDAAVRCLQASAEVTGFRYSLEFGGEIGRTSEARYGAALCDKTKRFCADVFSRGGAILSGPGGGRFVYDLRKEFALYCKLSPLRPLRALRDTGCLKPDHVSGVDILVVRENLSGLYQGTWSRREVGGCIRAEHTFHYWDEEVMDILRAAAGVAKMRKGRLSVVHKESGTPSISDLWKSCVQETAKEFDIEYEMIDVDYAVYRLVRDAPDIDVMVAPNLFGDILGDLGALLLGSRGMSYSGNFSKSGSAVYQTNHGAAYDLAGWDRANPVGQILSLSMLLRESMGMNAEAGVIEQAVERVLGDGYRTFDIATEGCRVAGTRELGERIANCIRNTKIESSVVDDGLSGPVTC